MTQIHSSLVKEMIESGLIEIDEGELRVWDMPCVLYPLNSIFLIDVLKDRYPQMSMAELNFQVGSMQCRRGNSVLTQRFGFVPDEKLIRDAFGKSELLGMGIFEFIEFDLQKRRFTMINASNPYAHHYLKVFGLQEMPVCHYLRGLCTGNFMAFFDDELLGVEVACVARGEKACIFCVKPLADWDLSNPLVSAQVIRHKLPHEVFDQLYSMDALMSARIGVGKKNTHDGKKRERLKHMAEMMRLQMAQGYPLP